MPAFRRYAIYYTPPPGPLAGFGAAWLGWDIAAGRTVDHRTDIAGLPASLDALTETPRRYGFHATVKPPFHLAAGQTQAALSTALAAFSRSHAPAPLPTLEIARLGRFVAIVPADDRAGDTAAINALAAAAVRQLDDFRAPPSEADIARHQSAKLTADQIRTLHRWGYPHVMQHYRWHMTLTGKHPRAVAEETRTALIPALAPLLAPPPIIDALSLVGEDSSGHFHLIRREPLTG